MRKRNMSLTGLLLLFILALPLMGCQQQEKSPVGTAIYAPGMAAAETERLARFEAELEYIRQQLKIPALSAAIVREQELVWAKGFGYADLEKQVAATPDTPYHLASVTKPFAAVILMQLVEEGVLDLDAPVSQYGLQYGNSAEIQVRHLLTHTSEGQPGTSYRYNGDRFGDLGYVIRRASGHSFVELLTERILEPLDMTHTAPNPMSMGDGILGSLNLWLFDRNGIRVRRDLARPYQLDPAFNVVEGAYPEMMSPAAGLIASVVDLAKFDIAMDQNVLLSSEAKEQMFAPTISTSGGQLPYGQGWFTQSYQDTRLIWHYGHWPPCVSSLFLKVPEKDLTFIILANTDNLSRPYDLGSGEMLPLDSTVGLAFYKTFVFEPKYGFPIPRMDWEASQDDLVNQLMKYTDEDLQEILERELLSYRRLFYSVGRTDLADRLVNVHAQVYAPSRLDNYAKVMDVGDWNLPLPSVVLPGMRHLIAVIYALPVFLSIFIAWPIAYLVQRLRRRRSGQTAVQTGRISFLARVVAVLAALVMLVVLFLYISYLSTPAEWAGGTPWSKVRLGVSLVSIAFSLALVLMTVLAWKNRAWSAGWRVHYTLVALAGLLCAYLWPQLGLLG